MKTSYIYIMTTKNNGPLYIGVTSDIKKRVSQHRDKIYRGFTNMYQVEKLIYYEKFDFIPNAIKREKQLKKWNRKWKVRLINKINPEWEDLSEETF